jgi:hypothetical protein
MMDKKTTKVLHFVEMNRPRLELYRKITRVLALAISLLALYFFIGGMIRSYLYPGGDIINRFGFIASVPQVLERTLRLFMIAFTLFAVGEYLHYLVRDDKAPRFAKVLLPVALLGVAIAGFYRVAESFYWMAEDLEAGFGRSIIFTTFMDVQVSALTRSAATIGLAIIIVHLTRVIEEEKALV